MGDSYTEQLVRQKASKEILMRKVLLIVGVVVLFFISMIIQFLTILPALGIVALIYLWGRWKCVEYEYIYFNGELDVDRILGMEARKRVISVSAKEMAILAPTGAPELRQYQQLKVYDCSSKTENKTYEIVASLKGQNVRIIFEPNDTILEGMKFYAPHKVFL